MVVRKRTKLRRGVPPGAIVHLAHGYDFFGEGFGDDVYRNGPVDLNAMRQAWRDAEIRRQVCARQNTKFPGSLPFAEIAFGPDGDANPHITAAGLSALREEYHAQRDAA